MNTLKQPSVTARSTFSYEWLGVVLLALAFFLRAGWGERVTAGGGLGWDGITYGAFTKDFLGTLLLKGVDPLRAQRLLPSLVVHLVLRGIHVARTDANIILFYEGLAWMAVVIAAILFAKMARLLKFSSALFGLGLIVGFINFQIGNFLFYYPVLTDSSALLLGFASLYAYLHDYRALLFILAAIGMFCWPVAFACNGLLLIFPRRHSESIPTNSLELGIAALATVIFLAIAIQLFFFQEMRSDRGIFVNPKFWPFSTLIAAAYFGSIFVVFGKGMWRKVRSDASLRQLTTLAILVGLGLLGSFVSGWLVANYPTTDVADSVVGLSKLINVSQSIFRATVRPGLFLVAHSVCFGPLFILSLLLAPRIGEAARELGTGVVGCLVLHACLALNSESRILIYGLPFFLVVLCQSLKGISLGKLDLTLAFFLCFLTSRIWYPLNHGPFTDDPLAYPDQYYFMTQGPWIIPENYRWQGVLVLLVTVVLLFWSARRGLTSFPSRNYYNKKVLL